jgi:hypothetical protein
MTAADAVSEALERADQSMYRLKRERGNATLGPISARSVALAHR